MEEAKVRFAVIERTHIVDDKKDTPTEWSLKRVTAMN